eukprot:8261481-Pyramimonas_sp.AAC.1
MSGVRAPRTVAQCLVDNGEDGYRRSLRAKDVELIMDVVVLGSVLCHDVCYQGLFGAPHGIGLSDGAPYPQ